MTKSTAVLAIDDVIADFSPWVKRAQDNPLDTLGKILFQHKRTACNFIIKLDIARLNSTLKQLVEQANAITSDSPKLSELYAWANSLNKNSASSDEKEALSHVQEFISNGIHIGKQSSSTPEKIMTQLHHIKNSIDALAMIPATKPNPDPVAPYHI
jgi:hypothetical protein